MDAHDIKGQATRKPCEKQCQNIERAATGMGYRWLGRGVLAKPVGKHLFVIRMSDATWSNTFIGMDNKTSLATRVDLSVPESGATPAVGIYLAEIQCFEARAATSYGQGSMEFYDKATKYDL